MKVIHKANGEKHFTKSEAPYGWIFLGRDAQHWGEEGTGLITVDPDKECENGCPHYNDVQYDAVHDPIHLNVAAYRDRLCPRTLFNLFNKAQNPRRIFLRLIQQIDSTSSLNDDADCWERFCRDYPQLPCDQFKDQVQMLTMEAKSSKGPTDPRSKLSAMVAYDYLNADKPMLLAVKPQHYCMQTDSHMDFSQDFDTGLIEMFHRARNDYAVLSTYVADIVQNDSNPSNVPQLCMVEMSNTWRNWGTKFCEHLVRPKLTNVAWGAGLSFSKCHAELNVPYDPFLPYVFNGEELSRGIRFFTNGYDMYTPDQVLVTHDYHGHQSNPIVHSWGRHRKEGRSLRGGDKEDGGSDMSIFMHEILEISPLVVPNGTDRLNILMGITDDKSAFDKIAPSRYGLGDRRTLQDSIDFSGFDPVKRRMTKNTCGNLAWVPYEEDDFYGLEKNFRRPLWTETSLPKTTTLSHDLPEKAKEALVSETREAMRGPDVKHWLNAEEANRHDKPEILLLVVIFVMVALAMLFGRRKGYYEYSRCNRRKTARLVR